MALIRTYDVQARVPLPVCIHRYNCGGVADRSVLLFQLPPGSTESERSALFAAMLLVDFTEMERRRQFDCNNTGGATAGGGAPEALAMER